MTVNVMGDRTDITYTQTNNMHTNGGLPEEKHKTWHRLLRHLLIRNITTLLSIILTGMVLLPKVAAHGFRRGIKASFPLIGLSCLVFLANELTAALMRYKKDSHAFRLTTGIILWVAAPPAVLVITQHIIKFSWRLRPEYLWYNLCLLFLLLIPVTVICGSFKWSVIIYSVILTLIVLISFYVNKFRGKPLTIFDILGARTAADVISGYVIRIYVKTGICLQVLLLFLTLQVQLQTIRLPRKTSTRLVRLGIAVGSILCLWLFCRQYLWTLEWMQGGDDFSLNKTYMEKGFYPKFISGLVYLHISEPEGYSIEAVESIVERFGTSAEGTTGIMKEQADGEADGTTAAQTDGEEFLKKPKNIIVVMNESFADLEMFGEIDSDREILPNLHALESGDGIYVQKGLLHVHAFGGGTANSEYEMLTGNTLYFLANNVVAYEVYCHNPEYGLVTTLKDQGYETVAIHPGKESAWSRNMVYPEMGFDRTIFKNDWNEEQEYETIRGWVSDRETYQKIRQVYEERDSNKGLFVFCVTIQNHGGYSAETADGYEPDVHLNYDQSYPETEMYLSLLRESDRAFKEDLLDYFAKVSEPTMIVFYGDHQVAPEGDRFYTEIIAPQAGAGENSSEITAIAQNRFVTPVVIWTNYAPGTEGRALMEEDLELSSNYLGNYVLELAGLEMTPYNRFLMKMQEQLPIMGVGAVMLPNNTWMSDLELDSALHTDEMPAEDNSQLARCLHDYQIMQYNNTIDWRNKVSEGFTIAEELVR